MSNNLFNNKYYKQLFGGRKQEQEQDDEHTEDTRQRLERIFGGRKQEQEQDERTEDTRQRLERIFGGRKQEQEQEQDDERTEDTRQRLERIFGGARQKGSKNRSKAEIAAAKAAKVAGRVSDADYMARYGPNGTGKFTNEGMIDGKLHFGFKNGAVAIRDDSGRFIIRRGASSETLDDLRKLRAPAGTLSHKVEKKHPGGLIKAAAAKKAFQAYWNRKLREAKKYDAKHPDADTLKYVKRNKTYHTKYARHNPELRLDESSPKGYLYLRKERVLRQPDGSPSVYGPRSKRAGELRIRRAGPAIYDFIGVAPETLKFSDKGKTKAADWTPERHSYVPDKWGHVEKLEDWRDENPAMSEEEMAAHVEARKQAHKNRDKAATAANAIRYRDETIAAHRVNRGKSTAPVHSPHMAWADSEPAHSESAPVSPIHRRRV
jgi:hypothetical protein